MDASFEGSAALLTVIVATLIFAGIILVIARAWGSDGDYIDR